MNKNPAIFASQLEFLCKIQKCIYLRVQDLVIWAELLAQMVCAKSASFSK